MARKKPLLANQQNRWNNWSVQRKDWELVPVTSLQYKLISNSKVPYVLLNDILQSNLISITHNNALLQLRYGLLNDLHNAAIEPSKCSLVQNNLCTSEIFKDRQKQEIDSKRKQTIKKRKKKERKSTKKQKLHKEKTISFASDPVDTLPNNVDELKKGSTETSEIGPFDKELMKITIKTTLKRGRRKVMKVCLGSHQTSTSFKAIGKSIISANQKKVPTIEENSAIPKPANVETSVEEPDEVHVTDEINNISKVDCTLQPVTLNDGVNCTSTSCDIPTFDCSTSPHTDNKFIETSCRGLVHDCTASQSKCTTYNSQNSHSMAVHYDDSNVERKEHVTSINYLQSNSTLTEDNVHFGQVICNDAAILLNNNKDLKTEITNENDINDFQNDNVQTLCETTSSKNIEREFEGSYNTLKKRRAPINSIRRSQSKNDRKKCIVKNELHFKKSLLDINKIQVSDLSLPNGNACKRKTVSEPNNNATLSSMSHISSKTEYNTIPDIEHELPYKRQRIVANNLNMQSNEEKSNSKNQNLQISNKIFEAPLQSSDIKPRKRKTKKTTKKVRNRTASVIQATNQHKETNGIVQSQEQSNWTRTGNNAEPDSSGNPCIQASEDNFKLSQSNSCTDASSEISYESSNVLHRYFENENQDDKLGKNLFGNEEETTNIIPKVLGGDKEAVQQSITPGKTDGTESQCCIKHNKRAIKLNRTPCFARAKSENNLADSSLHKNSDDIFTSKSDNSATITSSKTNAKDTRSEINFNKSILDERDSFINEKCINSSLSLDKKCNSSNEKNNNVLIDTLINTLKSTNIDSETPKSDIEHSNALADTPMDTLKSTKIDSETPKSDIQHNIVHKKNVVKDPLDVPLLEAENSTTNKESINKAITEDVEAKQDDSNSDCISLYAESLGISDCDYIADDNKQIPQIKNFEDEYSMTDSNFDVFIKKNSNAFIEEYESLRKDKSNNLNVQSATQDKVILPVETCASVNTQMTNPFLSVKNITHIPMNTLNMDRFIHKKYFVGYCFGQLKRGHCPMVYCPYDHNVRRFCARFASMDVSELSRLINIALTYEYKFFGQQLYLVSLEAMKNYLDIFQLYKHLYQCGLSSDNIVTQTIKILRKHKMELPLILEHLSPIIRQDDPEAFQSIINIVSAYIPPTGEYWKTIKALSSHVTPGRQVIDTILKECVRCQKDPSHVQDVYINLINRLGPDERAALNNDVWNNFIELLQNSQLNNSSYKTTCHISKDKCIIEDTIASPDAEHDVIKNLQKDTAGASNAGDKSQMHPKDLKSTRASKILQKSECTPVQCNADKDIFCVDKQSNKGTSNSFVVHPVDNIPSPGSAYTEKVFWKFDCDRNCLRKGLLYEDYDYVISILEKYACDDHKSLFAHACYHILRQEIMHSQHYLTQIIERTVQTGKAEKLGNMLHKLTVYILTALVDEGDWVLARRLQKSVRLYNFQCNAAFILLSAEIYLANHQSVKALNVVKKYNIVYTNRNKWCVPNNNKDEPLRAKIISIMLESLCAESTEHAYFLIEFLIKDQLITTCPIDLPHYVNKVMSAILLEKNIDLIVNLGRLLIDFNFTLPELTFRAVVIILLQNEPILAKKLYQYAIGLGVYNTVKLNPITFIIINCDWTEEEIYLTFDELLLTLSRELGPCIDRVKPHQLAVFIVFEVLPSKTQLYYNQNDYKSANDKIWQSKQLVRNVLEKRFNPPVAMVKKDQGRLCKMLGSSLANYLKVIHGN